MEFLKNFDLVSLLDTIVSLLAAFILGGLIGLERQYRQRTAGLRTNVLVALGAAIFVDIANRLHGHEGAVHVIAYVVSGIGFLGAGVIMREEGNVRGLNTAATLWCSGAIGACAGADLIIEASIATAFVLAANTLLRPVGNLINRQPLDSTSVEVTHTVSVIVSIADQKDALKLLESVLDEADYAFSNLEIQAFGDDAVIIEAVLAASSVNGEDLDLLIEKIAEPAYISQAYWTPSTTS
jgi:putative Mg2+ transporter-C (MgtC) family protein